MSNITLTFHGGVDSVTGANFLIETGDTKVLVDCGMTQGSEEKEGHNWDPFPYDPSTIDYLIITHAHIDHIGRVGKLINEGFSGEIVSTPPTKALAEIMLEDAQKVLSYKYEKGGRKPYFTSLDIQKALSLWSTHKYNETYKISELTAVFKDAGHILGSSMLHLEGEKKGLVFTGDIGNRNGILTSTPDTLKGANYVVMESVYGDRLHEDARGRREHLKKIIEKTISNKGVLMIPAFSLERTQILLYELNELIESDVVPSIPVFLDSPLAIRVTNLYREYSDYFDEPIKKDVESGDDIFDFPGLKMTETKDASKEISKVSGPKIIIAGAGMSHAGRIVFHEERYLGDPKNTLLIVGYQSPGSFGRRLLEGQKNVKLLGKTIKVKASIEKLLTFSSHADRDDLMSLIESGSDTLEHVFIAMGENKSRAFLSQRIREYTGIKTSLPEPGDSVVLEI